MALAVTIPGPTDLPPEVGAAQNDAIQLGSLQLGPAEPDRQPPPPTLARRRLSSYWIPLRGPRSLAQRLCHACCCDGCGTSQVLPINKVLPVTFNPNESDFLEIRPHRRIRVIHRYGLAAAPPRPVLGPWMPPPGQADQDSLDGLPVQLQRDGSDPVDESEEEDYWFENAAPRRPPIQAPTPRQYPPNRIFNKFEPQQPPCIPGIQPPATRPSRRASVSSVRSRNHSRSPARSHRLSRKVIIPSEQLEDEEEDGETEDSNFRDLLPTVDPLPETDMLAKDPIPSAQSSVMDENFVATVLSDMNDMILNITADSTGHGSPSQSPEPTERLPPTSDSKYVESEPNPNEREHSNISASEVKIVVDGGNLGGHANSAFEGDEEREFTSESTMNGNAFGSHTTSLSDQSVNPAEKSDSSSNQISNGKASRNSSVHESDAGYQRVRNLSQTLALAVSEDLARIENANGEDDSELDSPLPEEQDEGDPLPRNHNPNKDNPSSEDRHALISMHPNPIPSDVISNGDNSISSLGQPLPTRPVIFFIHGVGGSASTWSNQVKYFTEYGYEVIVPDLLGHGFSSVPDNPKSYTFNKLFRDLITIFDHYIVDGRQCVIIAHSYGCSFGAAIARIRPNNVVLLILIACGGPSPLTPPRMFKTMPTILVSCMKPFLRCGFLRQQQYNPRGRQIKFQRAFDVPSYVFKHIMAGQHWPEGDPTFHRRISTPSLLVYGMKDPFVSLVEMCEMERTMPKAFLELVPLAGHMIMLEQPKQLSTMMRRFIEKYYPPP
ncbi:hypothetical protein TCAL_03585 [Tigriopus californicus]|uniref:acylglycerol lipase n=1 Tax=Tigriopus californicus TaxID=6832 RepID=A0A553NES5_TIGCA|nr:uncharacterized protein LOC131889344 [Tigriopus californicus]TRY63947.1 hypothetical protein TCAL_03585 [Tigriopus californicus]|eukprot:TCALIF_03585-PA protein Name:"Similar to Abhd8 Abhydrolase domain-containing protein 8 (Mus musculus)" AED:0.01 eAED:0.01 QI:484/1/0.5/1/1/0.5/2/0/776